MSVPTPSHEPTTVMRDIFDIVTAIKTIHNEERELDKAARLAVYKALSLHPAVDAMRPPTGVLGDLDWYTELHSPWDKFRVGMFNRLGRNSHFTETSLLGEVGTRARIMMLLLWIIAHRLTRDHVNKLLSTAILEGLPATAVQQAAFAQDLQELAALRKVVAELATMFKTKLPLQPDRNPFMGDDYVKADEDKPLPRDELWGYKLPPSQQYEYDVRRNPSVLLRPLPSKVIIPQTKLTLLVIQWATQNFGLGKKVHKPEDIDDEAFWNADPPLAD